MKRLARVQEIVANWTPIMAAGADVSDSSITCSATMGRIAVPGMLKAGYHPELSTGTVAVAGTIGALMPPSIVMILYGIVVQVLITDLFLGGAFRIVKGLSASHRCHVGYLVVLGHGCLRVWCSDRSSRCRHIPPELGWMI